VSISSPLRERNLAALTARTHDVLVVGGGINGASSAAALAARGVSVALIERGDFASVTSQESSNLIWGGIKYLENYELSLVWDLCRARNELIRSYPSSVREIRFFTPIKKEARGLKRTLPALYAGTWLYWLMGRGFTRPPRWLTTERIRREQPNVDVSIFKGGVEYSDAYLIDNDARFVFGFVRSALGAGAAAANYVELKGSERDGDEWKTQAVDRVTGNELTIRSRVLVNAAGPYVDELNRRNGVNTGTHHVFSKGIHLIVDRVTTRDRVLTFFDETDRMFFVIPMAHRSVIGTTDTRVDRPESEVTKEDRRYVLENVNHHLDLDRPLREEDVIAERCGVRPLAVRTVKRAPDTDQDAWFALSRKHVVDVDQTRGCLSIFGGKLTDCLNIGEEIVGLVRKLGIALGPESVWYGEPSIEERRAYLKAARANAIEPELAERLWRRYGADAPALLEEIVRDPRMGEPVIEGTRARRCELVHAARAEMVVTLKDFLRRRTKIALLHRRTDLEQARGMQEACEILGGDGAQVMFDEYFRS
jgi:glycerol-3-phosphate dehydrogenase